MSCDKLKILHVITSLRAGGAERLVTDLVCGLKERGHCAEVLLFDGTRTHLHEVLEQHNIRIHSLGTGACSMRNPLHVFRLGRYLDRRKFDIVHTHNTSCQLFTALAAPAAAPVLVTTEHNTFNRRRRWRWYACADRWMYSRYDHVICVGEQTRSNLVRMLGCGECPDRISVVPNGIRLDRFFGAVPDDTLRLDAERGSRIVTMVSAFRPQKDQPTLIRAMRSLPADYTLWLVGDWKLRASCERLAAESGVAGRVRFWGFRSDVPELLASSDVVVLSSHYEGMPLAAVEGMASGKAVIASDVEGLRETVGGAGLLFPHEDHECLAALIRKVCEDEGFGAEIASRCRERAAEYDIERTVSAYERLYGRLANEKQKL